MALLVLACINSGIFHRALQTLCLCGSPQCCKMRRTTKAFQLASNHLMFGSLTEALAFKKLVTMFTLARTLALSMLSWQNRGHLKYGMAWCCCSFIKLLAVFIGIYLLHTDGSLESHLAWPRVIHCYRVVLSQLLPRRNLLTVWPWHCALAYVRYKKMSTDHIGCGVVVLITHISLCGVGRAG